MGRLVHCMLYHAYNVKGGVHNVKGGMKYPDLTVYGQPDRTAGKNTASYMQVVSYVAPTVLTPLCYGGAWEKAERLVQCLQTLYVYPTSTETLLEFPLNVHVHTKYLRL